MDDACPACGAPWRPGELRCPACGLVVSGGPPDEVAAPVPPHASAYLGTTPAIVAEGPSATGVPADGPGRAPGAGTPPAGRLGARLLVAAGALLVAVVALVSIAPRRAPDGPDFAAFRDRPELRAAAEAEPFDDEAALAALAREHPDEVRRAREEHRPLDVPPGADLHAFFDVFLARHAAADPFMALALGVHPHPRVPSAWDAGDAAAALLVLRDASRIVRAWPPAASSHERADLDALGACLEEALRPEHVTDRGALASLHGGLDPLFALRTVPCCPGDDRAAAAVALLDATAAWTPEGIAGLTAPPALLVEAAAARLWNAHLLLEQEPEAWHFLSAAAHAEITRACRATAAVLREGCLALGRDVLPRAVPGAGLGPSWVASQLRRRHGLPWDARAAYAAALDALEDAEDALGDVDADDVPPASSVAWGPPDRQLRDLRDGAGAWLADLPPDPGLRCVPPPLTWKGSHGAFYVDGGPLAPRAPGVVVLPDLRLWAPGAPPAYLALEARHTLAHEGTPGHRLQALVAATHACRLRRFVDDRCLVEGWACYAEDLLHETGGCRPCAADDLLRAGSRRSRAQETLFGLLLATGAATDAELVELRAALGYDDDAPRAAIGELAFDPLYRAHYLIGRDEVVRLRRREERRLGAAFDARAFHGRLLRAGPIAPRRIEAEWDAEDAAPR